MDPQIVNLIMLGMSIGAQAIQTYNANKGTMTPEQKILLQPFIDRITAAQEMVTPYQKEPIQ